ncbi:UNVERIFIED_CONTAM: hypothetical protein Cloal_0193 [Acetivibrio alkalicellulosi]
MSNNVSRRGPDPKDSTVRILWGKAAGICQYRGCNEKLFYDETTSHEFNAAYIAHIVASSPDGPRGDTIRSHQLSDKINNLMIMCDKHHRLIDREDKAGHPESLLLEMKREHEENIERVCNYLNVQKTEIINFLSPIKGNQVSINYNDTVKAVLTKKQPYSQYGKIIDIKSIYPISDTEHWNDLNTQLEYQFLTKIKAMYDSIGNVHMSLFSIAPIPLIIKLGVLFGDKTNVDIFHKTRVPDTWCWQDTNLTNSFRIDKTPISKGKNIALILSLTDTIADDRVTSVLQPNAIYKIIAEINGVDCIKSEEDLSAFWHVYQQVCNEIFNTYGGDCTIHLFSAIPVCAAFEVGRRRMPGLHPKVTIYDDNGGFIPTLTIGG